MTDSGDDSPVQLPAYALAALEEFRLEQAERERNTRDDHIEGFTEDWQLSQFWYTDESSDIIAREAVRIADGGVIACLSCPSIYFALKRIEAPNKAYLMEYDPRFGRVGDDFVQYDYNKPTELPEQMKGECSVLIIDPPHLLNETVDDYATTREFIGKDGAKTLTIWDTTSVLEEYLDKYGMKPTTYWPEHSSKLGNRFRSYANFEHQLPNNEHTVS